VAVEIMTMQIFFDDLYGNSICSLYLIWLSKEELRGRINWLNNGVWITLSRVSAFLLLGLQKENPQESCETCGCLNGNQI
jgi:hypothetical protein